ncbi:MAG: globin domain-containing protein [Bacilli bacterium]
MSALSQETIHIVKTSIPALQEHGLVLTQTFYKTMFSRNPELKNIFNMSNQRPGGKQPLALAQSILAAAENIENLERILPAIQHIGHKHRSLAITPAMYNIVGENLLLALQEVFHQDAQSPFIIAWGEAYGAIASAFIGMEREMVKNVTETHGWEGFKPFKVSKIVQENDFARSIYVSPVDQKPLAPHKNGQYISISLPLPSLGYTQPRQYTLVEKTAANEWRICVKNEPGGVVSQELHTNLEVGQELNVSAPAGTFVVSDVHAPTLFIAGGIGITPIRAMMNEFIQFSTSTSLIYGVRNSAHHALKEEIEAFAHENSNFKLTTVYSEPLPQDADFTCEGFVTPELLQSHLVPNVQIYLCGPTVFMQAIKNQLEFLQVPTENIHFEQFGPAVGLA